MCRIIKIPKKLKQIAEQITKNAEKQRKLNTELNKLLEEMGVDLGDRWLLEPIAALEGDCSTDLLYDYLEEL